MQSSTRCGVLLAFLWLGTSSATQAESADEPSQRAARLFDEGVLRFQREEYAASARAFLDADRLVPNSEALKNALIAALRAHDSVLIARAADRALRQPEIDASAAAAAREALAAALQQVAAIEVRCTPVPCSIQLDGVSVASGTAYALPGTHVLAAEGSGGTRASAQLQCVAGASYRVELQLTASAAPAAPDSAARSPTASQPLRSKPATHSSKTTSGKPLSPVVFIVGCAGTAVLAGLVTWSGLEALSAGGTYEKQREAAQLTEVRNLQHRTNYFLAGAAVLGAATGAAGLWLVDWRSKPQATQVSVLLGPAQLGLIAQGRF